MADAITTVSIIHQRGIQADSVAADVVGASSASNGIAAVARRLSAIAAGIEGGTVDVRVDNAAGLAASGSVACTQASATAGDKLHIIVPGFASPFTLTGVAGAASSAAGEFSIDTSDTAMGNSLRDAINGLAGLRDIVSATASTGTVTISSRVKGEAGNNVRYEKVVTTAGALTLTQPAGGLETTARPSITVTFGSPDIVANDQISIGNRVYTWKASASADGEITLSTTPATAAANFEAAVNSDARFKGLLTASRASAVVTLTWTGGARVGTHLVMSLTETNAGSIVLGGATLIGADRALTTKAAFTSNSSTSRYVCGGTA